MVARERIGKHRMLKLYSGPLSLFSRKVEIALAEKGLIEGRDYLREMVPFTQERGYQPKHPAVLAINPKGQVPVLMVADDGLYDSTLILEYLEEKFPAPPLLPALAQPNGAERRAAARQMELYADEVLFPLMRKLAYRTEALPADAEQRATLEAAGATAEQEIRRHYGLLDRQLDRKEFLCGALSIADIGLFMTMLYIRRMHGPKPHHSTPLARWWLRLVGRPSFARAADEITEADRESTPALAAYAALHGHAKKA